MKQTQILVLTLIGGLVYALSFYEASWGINVWWFDLYLVLAYQLVQRGRPVGWQAGMLLWAGANVALAHTALAQVIHAFALVVFVGYAQQPTLRWVGFSYLLGLWSVATGWWELAKQGLAQRTGHRYIAVWRKLWLVGAPVAVTVPFVWLYRGANPVFDAWRQQLVDWLWVWGSWQIDLSWWGWLCFGLAVAAGVLVVAPGGGQVWAWEMSRAWILRRGQKMRFPWPRPAHGALALRREYRGGVITLGLLNGLLLVANLADLSYLWQGAHSLSAAVLSQYVHQGTWLLMASIGLAMVVVVCLFRGNLNFYTPNHHLRILATIWLAQNAWLALSVAARNGMYITQHGLAYGRIVVAIFLVLVLAGLFTLYQKIHHQHSFYRLLSVNGQILVFTLLMAATINWDVVITRYNLSMAHRQRIDLHYLLEELSHQNYYLLQAQRVQLLHQGYSAPLIEEGLADKARHIAQLPTDYRAWNWPDARNRRAYYARLEAQ